MLLVMTREVIFTTTITDRASGMSSKMFARASSVCCM